jgi:hypothetical protein
VYPGLCPLFYSYPLCICNHSLPLHCIAIAAWHGVMRGGATEGHKSLMSCVVWRLVGGFVWAQCVINASWVNKWWLGLLLC